MITSAINCRYGSFDAPTRLSQTIDTIQSIRLRLPDAECHVVEVGPQALNDQQRQLIWQQGAVIWDANHIPTVQQIYQIVPDNDMWIKTPCELLALIAFFNAQDFITSQDRIYKISGRYLLSHDFDANRHDFPGQLVFGPKMPPVQYYCAEGSGIMPMMFSYQRSTRLYSFCGSLMMEMIKRYKSMLELVIDMYQRLEFADVEHVMAHFISDLPVIEIEPLGVMGYQAPSGDWISE